MLLYKIHIYYFIVYYSYYGNNSITNMKAQYSDDKIDGKKMYSKNNVF